MKLRTKYVIYTVLVIITISFLLIGLSFISESNYIDKSDKKSNDEITTSNYMEEKIIYDETKNYSFIPHANQGTSTGLVNDENNTLIEERNFTTSKTFNTTIAIANQNNYKEKYLIIPLINYKQSEVLVEGKMKNKIEIELDSKEVAFIPNEINYLDKGSYDFTFLIVQDPDNKKLSEEYRLSTLSAHLFSIRGTINVDKTENDKIKKDKFKRYESVDSQLELDGILLTKERNFHPWLIEEVKREDINFNINIGNMANENKNYALVSFLDWEQVPVNENEDVVFGNIKTNSIQLIKGSLDADNIKEKEVSNYTTIYVPYPYEEVDSYDPKYIVEPAARIGLNNK